MSEVTEVKRGRVVSLTLSLLDNGIRATWLVVWEPKSGKKSVS